MEHLIAGLDFPVTCCLGLAYYIKYQNEQMIADNREDKEMWRQELQYSREVMTLEEKVYLEDLIEQDLINSSEEQAKHLKK